jgi:hypothetical protein
MYALTALLCKFIDSVRSFFTDLLEAEPNDCLFCAHHDLALRREPVYTCPRCKTVYTRKEE